MAWLVWIDNKFKWHCSNSPTMESAENDAKVMMNKCESKLDNAQVTFIKAGLFSHYALIGNLIPDTNRENGIRKSLGYPSQVWIVDTESRGKAIMTAKSDYQHKILAKVKEGATDEPKTRSFN